MEKIKKYPKILDFDPAQEFADFIEDPLLKSHIKIKEQAENFIKTPDPLTLPTQPFKDFDKDSNLKKTSFNYVPGSVSNADLAVEELYAGATCLEQKIKAFSSTVDVEEKVVRPKIVHIEKAESISTIEQVSVADSESSNEVAKPSCSYCGLYSAKCLVRCNVSSCQKWFCNGQMASAGSHIINHLVRAKHKEVYFGPDSSLGEQVLECYGCGSRNVFLLGFLPHDQENIVFLLCREPCLSYSPYDQNLWQPLIVDRVFLNWLVLQPTQAEIMEQVKYTVNPQHLTKLEQFWKVQPEATIEDLNKPGVDSNTVPSVLLRYDNAYHYQNTFAPLVKIEADYDRKVKEAQRQEDVTVRWDIGLNQKRLAYFIFTKEANESRLVIGDELRLIYQYGPNRNNELWSCAGHVAKLTQTEEVCLELRPTKSSSGSGPWTHGLTTGFTVEFVWKATSFDRMQSAMRKLALNDAAISSYLYSKLMGQNNLNENENNILTPLPRHMSAPNLAHLNHSQVFAVQKTLQSALTLIQGPPGTGKTVTSATIVHHLKQLNQDQILVAAPSNVAVDQLAEKIHMTGLKVVRICARSRESATSPIDFLNLHKQVIQLASKASGKGQEFQRLLNLKEETGDLSEKDEKKLLSLRIMFEKEILRSADVICTTCVGAGDPRLSSSRFKYVLIDESTQATEPECLIPIVMGAQQLILVGDHCQLGPVIMCKSAAKAGLSQSLFERLVLLGFRPLRLEVQYRMHPCLSEFSSQAFYEGLLQNGVTISDRYYENLASFWPRSEMPMFFHHTTGYEELSASGTSYLNRSEAHTIEKFVTFFFKSGVQAHQIGVITPYDGQRAYISMLFQRQAGTGFLKYSDIEVASVDAFQGREKDFVMLSCVRSNRNVGIGFLQDPRRLNVALTRAKYGMIIFGNAKVLAKQHHKHQTQIWCDLLNHMKRLNLLIEGPISALRPANITLPQPSRFITSYQDSEKPDIKVSSENQLNDNSKNASYLNYYFKSYTPPEPISLPPVENLSLPGQSLTHTEIMANDEGPVQAPSKYFPELMNDELSKEDKHSKKRAAKSVKSNILWTT